MFIFLQPQSPLTVFWPNNIHYSGSFSFLKKQFYFSLNLAEAFIFDKSHFFLSLNNVRPSNTIYFSSPFLHSSSKLFSESSLLSTDSSKDSFAFRFIFMHCFHMVVKSLKVRNLFLHFSYLNLAFLGWLSEFWTFLLLNFVHQKW